MALRRGAAHRSSPINCGAIPASLIQSELFGHERGAYRRPARKRGLIESAQGGSLFLDEIGDLPLELQANLLRFLQEKTIYRLGSQPAFGGCAGDRSHARQSGAGGAARRLPRRSVLPPERAGAGRAAAARAP
jgi:sigma54-dependent transcription regulator